MKKCVATSRSIASIIVLAIATEGMANRIMNDTTRMDHTYSGMRLSDIPGARILRIVTIISIAATSAAISVNVTTCAHTSTRLPGAYSGPDSGTYANQPVSGPVFV